MKTTYSDEEIKQILQALFLEKKKTKELTAKLEEQPIGYTQVKEQDDKSAANPNDIKKLKQLVQAFKNRFDQTVKHLQEKDQQIELLNQEMEYKSSLEEENNSLILQVSFLKDSLKNLIEETQTLREQNRNDKKYAHIQDQLDEAEALRVNFERQALELIHQVHELEPYKELVEKANAKIEELEKSLNSHEEENTALLQQFNTLKLKLNSPNDDKNQQCAALQRQLVESETVLHNLEIELRDKQEQAERDRQKIEKLAIQLLEKDKRIADLQHLEISLKRAAEQKQGYEQVLEKEQHQIEKLIEQKKKLEEEKAEEKQHGEQLERVIQFLRERSEEARLETKQLEEDYQKSQETITSLKEQLQDFERKQIQNENLLKQMEKEKGELKEEIEILIKQFEELKQKIKGLETDLTQAIHSKTELHDLYESTSQQKENALKELEDKSAHYDRLEKEVLLIKQSLVRGLREVKELDSHYQETVQDRMTTAAKLIQSHHHIDRQKEQYDLLQEKFEAALESNREANRRMELLQRLLEEEQFKAEKIRENHSIEMGLLDANLRSKEESFEAYRQQMVELRKDNEKLENELEDKRDDLKEKENELTQAQQHFAKKVKESAILEEKYEEQRRLFQELQQAMTQGKVKIAELQTSLDYQIHQQKQQQDQWQEALKNAELSQSKWEEKYFYTYDKWQTAEARIKELEKIEEKQKHLQGILSNLGSFFGNQPPPLPNDLLKPETETKKKLEPESSPMPEEKPVDSAKTYPNLFNRPKPPGRPRQNFLE